MAHSIRYYLLASLFILFVEGILVWLFGRPPSTNLNSP
ncbi:hypothetical protein XNC1_0011 [Xenorhabdus nematophila ATCC 19061]|uniref:Uncharacterized protein n=1 Tax=Xenorhabdus nematophila (strain ATCC 19061 / DSM 3370 / CCUG 14189 / LMG 1036 / NCIMB 9965 / AN6) TaxID=406817 RepID=D3VG14_XENNA|nr:hypothetical protein XNC1_0011 [Xenorhabdus nematophila ATCC 19061]